MSEEIEEIIILCDRMFAQADLDYQELISKEIDDSFFEDYNNIRTLNSFLFNFSKLQDKIGAKLFKKLLYELKEIDSLSMPMIDILNIMEQLEILEVEDWDSLRELRNILSHEYPFDTQERIDNIKLSLDAYKTLKRIYENLKSKL